MILNNQWIYSRQIHTQIQVNTDKHSLDKSNETEEEKKNAKALNVKFLRWNWNVFGIPSSPNTRKKTRERKRNNRKKISNGFSSQPLSLSVSLALHLRYGFAQCFIHPFEQWATETRNTQMEFSEAHLTCVSFKIFDLWYTIFHRRTTKNKPFLTEHIFKFECIKRKRKFQFSGFLSLLLVSEGKRIHSSLFHFIACRQKNMFASLFNFPCFTQTISLFVWHIFVRNRTKNYSKLEHIRTFIEQIAPWISLCSPFLSGFVGFK